MTTSISLKVEERHEGVEAAINVLRRILGHLFGSKFFALQYFDLSPHLTPAELDQSMQWKGKKTPNEVHALLASQRFDKDIEPVNLPSVRKALRSSTRAVATSA